MERIASLVELAITEEIVYYIISFVLTIHKLGNFLKNHAFKGILFRIRWDHLLQLMNELIFTYQLFVALLKRVNLT